MLTLTVMVFGFTAGASAQVCSTCKGALRTVDCPAAVGQGGACAINGFDYDDNIGNLVATHGYCNAIGGLEKYKAIFAICNCANAAAFVSGQPIAVRMEILVNGLTGERGAYWSGTGVPAIMAWDDFATQPAACAGLAQTRSFGAPSFWRGDGVTAVLPGALGVDPTCAVGAGARSTIITTPASVDVVAPGDGAYWWIDVPPVRIDPTVLKNNEIVSVKISIYDPTLPLPICPSCITCICECTIDIAQVCCAGPAPVTTNLTFNYFTSLATGDYWNGISISNPTGVAGSCVLTARQLGAAAACTATVAVPANSMFVDLLENITWTGTVNGAPCYLMAACDYGGGFGFAMMSNGNSDSMGYLAWTVLP
ncbi:MAG: hypothetical protein JXL20_02480 [Deltaproteobacteria bacterium]|nr:hypothetical protein [Deltaproteobacteria bacterium]